MGHNMKLIHQPPDDVEPKEKKQPGRRRTAQRERKQKGMNR